MVPQSDIRQKRKAELTQKMRLKINMRYFTQQRQPRDTDILHERRKTGIQSPNYDEHIVCAFNVCKLSQSPELLHGEEVLFPDRKRPPLCCTTDSII